MYSFYKENMRFCIHYIDEFIVFRQVFSLCECVNVFVCVVLKLLSLILFYSYLTSTFLLQPNVL